MPKGSVSPKEFVELANNPEAKWIKAKIISQGRWKYQLRTGKSTYTLTCNNEKINLFIQKNVPQNLKVEINDKKPKGPSMDDQFYQVNPPQEQIPPSN